MRVRKVFNTARGLISVQNTHITFILHREVDRSGGELKRMCRSVHILLQDCYGVCSHSENAADPQDWHCVWNFCSVLQTLQKRKKFFFLKTL
ncbi:hypothetical protein GDO78_019662 [Eleutherodactylus coqui]|uniref:Uncharacterized protein n=1 Tax=Eleutherodactylus coqui TaxID=57060 RepID=A0A8J6BIQ7_ELECQ|nr:hypothetical protein GDO78_019662 [Eleutherodactylus coqui]